MPNLFLGDCLDVLKTLPENSIDSLVTDPPAGIAFMGKSWDSDKGGRDHWIAWMTEIMREALRVMKPGAHALVWGLPRTSHWTATALENAGFEIRDVVTHLFGSGFPKSLDISKAIDKAACAKRDVLETRTEHNIKRSGKNSRLYNSAGNREKIQILVTAPATDEAKQWSGWGTALKPSVEFYILVRKPLSEKTVASNVLKHGTGGLNIDVSRIGEEERVNKGLPSYHGPSGTFSGQSEMPTRVDKYATGRFPSHLVLDEEAASLLDEQSLAGGMHSAGKARVKDVTSEYAASSYHAPKNRQMNRVGDVGGASRFFYCPKASKSDKGEFNIHPTCKSTKLMEYLIKLITPPNGVVLDCFMGSGSTGVAVLRAGFQFIGIEKEPEYFEIAEKRIANL